MLTRVACRKTSLIDFPGRVASVLFSPLCNFRCPYCHNSDLVDPAKAERDDSLVSLESFLAMLDRRRGLVSGVVLSGGEPLLYEEMPRVARACRERGLAVKLDTNGSFPERISSIEADYVALDFKTAPSAYSRVAGGSAGAGGKILESLEIIRASGAEYEIRITCAPGIVGEAEIAEMAAFLEAGDPVILQRFRPGGCLDPAWDSTEPYGEAVLAGLLAAIRLRAPLARLRGAG